MPGVVRPPYGAPTGPLLSDGELVATYLAGARTGHSPSLHVEEDVLLAERFVPMAIRVGPATVIIRTDIESVPLAAGCAAAGLALVEREPPLATVVALQTVGHSAAPWELWSADPRQAPAYLAAAATGDAR